MRTDLGNNALYQLLYADIAYYLFSFILPLILLALFNTRLILTYRGVHVLLTYTEFYRVLLTTHEAASYIILVLSVRLSVCVSVVSIMHVSVCQSITFESLDVGSSYYLHVRCVSTDYGSSSYMKVIGLRSSSQEPKRSKIPIPAM